MPVGSTSVSVVNESLQLIGSQVVITSLSDTTSSGAAAAKAASVLYTPTVELLLREIDPDFARYTVTLGAAVAPPSYPPWAYEYLWPTDCLRVRQVRPDGAAASLYDPQPVRYNVAFDLIDETNTKVILTNQASALLVYTSSLVTEVQWDAVFQDAVVRRLANPLAMSLAGRPDFAKEILMQSAQMAQTAEGVDDSGFRRGGA